MDDSRDVRIAAAGSVRAFSSRAERLRRMNVGYLLKGFVVHMDDANVDVQEATCRRARSPRRSRRRRPGRYARRKKHAHTRFVDRVLAACDAADEKGDDGGRWSGANDELSYRDLL